uniref:Uncharacterized protein n=1 Tax=Bartonella schoenbuchensis (strain DSM 13525 / NCTC 13165 / R1) TaxID=687861 RepID=E6YZJ7_BARSR|nr:hypothetical protein B11C_40140 [Bartonella schoenbuchensis R1]
MGVGIKKDGSCRSSISAVSAESFNCLFSEEGEGTLSCVGFIVLLDKEVCSVKVALKLVFAIFDVGCVSLCALL